jgi:predicted DNA-binding antitoxin AbrB/MazE fold protein
MATQTLEMVSENGVLRPVNGDLPIPHGEHVHVVLPVKEQTDAQPKPRIAGLHAGMIWMSDDFDDELPDSFWLGEE